jgi:hypothetical protein
MEGKAFSDALESGFSLQSVINSTGMADLAALRITPQPLSRPAG